MSNYEVQKIKYKLDFFTWFKCIWEETKWVLFLHTLFCHDQWKVERCFKTILFWEYILNRFSKNVYCSSFVVKFIINNNEFSKHFSDRKKRNDTSRVKSSILKFNRESQAINFVQILQTSSFSMCLKRNGMERRVKKRLISRICFSLFF